MIFHSRSQQNRCRHHQSGLTLIELMVSIVISLIVLAGVVQLMVDNKAKFLISDELSFIQENARFALDEMGRDLRMAGFSGCGANALVANVVDDATDFYNGFGIEGWDGSENAANFPADFSADLWDAGDAAAPDAFIIRRASGDDAIVIDDAAPNTNASAVIKILDSHDIQKGAIMVAVTPDCSQVSVFQNTLQNIANDADQFQHNTGAASPGNCTKDLFGSGDCSDTGGLSTKNFADGGMILEFISRAYYIGPSSIDATIPALYREKLQAIGGDSATQKEELLIGVENMQVIYGVDTDATADGNANRYVDADGITGVGTLDWDRVVSVRLELLLRSFNPVWFEDTTFTFDGTDYTDRFLRQRVSSTILLRNLALLE